jgi:hypothetical protein
MVCAQRLSINPIDAHALLNGTQQSSGRFVRVDIENGQMTAQLDQRRHFAEAPGSMRPNARRLIAVRAANPRR